MSVRVMELACQVMQIGNPNAITDAGTGAALAQAALTGSGYNVRINVLDLDESDAELLINQLEQLEKQAAQSTEQLRVILRDRGNLPI
jgi:formiminotetrahydrofolate cyclodeaminase